MRRLINLQQILPQAWLHRGPLAVVLLPISWLYGALVGLRRLTWTCGLQKPVSLPRPVVVVGNRVAGGAGKTPTVIAIVQHLKRQGWRVGVVSRGHGRSTHQVSLAQSDDRADQVGDEPLLIARRCQVPVAVGRDRVAAGRLLLERFPQLDILLADDGLQHLRLARQVEVVVFDERGAGNGWLLPAGPLRESIKTASLARTQLTIYNAPAASTALPGWLCHPRLTGFVRLADWHTGKFTAVHADQLAGASPLMAVAATGVPERFFRSLEALGLKIERYALPDHDPFAHLPWPASACTVLVTEKDAVKLDPKRIATERPTSDVWVAQLDFLPDPGFWSALDAALLPLRERPPASPPTA